MVDRLSGFDGQGTMEKRCGQGHLGRADDAFLGIKHEPSERWRINTGQGVAGKVENDKQGQTFRSVARLEV